MFDYIGIFDNATRRHSTPGMLSPSEYEMINQQQTPRVHQTGGSPKFGELGFGSTKGYIALPPLR